VNFWNRRQTNPKFKLIEGDCLDLSALIRAMAGCDFVFHLAANADVRFGLDHPHKDFQQNAVATSTCLRHARQRIKGIAFSSTAASMARRKFPHARKPSISGANLPDAASKLACEGFIQAYCEGYGFEGYIFRLSPFSANATPRHVWIFSNNWSPHPAN